MQTIQLHIYEKTEVPVLQATQGDVGRKFQAVITDGSTNYTIPADAGFTLWYSGTAGEGNYAFVGENSAFQVSEDTVTVELIAQMLACPGGGELCLCMSRPDGTWLGLWSIPYEVEALPGAGSPEATQSYTAFSDSVAKLQQAAEKIIPDDTLSQQGRPAEAAAVGAALEGKAPAGFGLGGASVTEKESADECTAIGWYKVQKGGIYGDGDSCYIHTVAFGIDGGTVNILQEGYRIGMNSVTQKLDYIKACRVYDGQEGWSEWAYENPPMTLSMEFLTTQRFGGKPVYTKLLSCGGMPDNDSAYVPGLAPNMTVIGCEVVLTKAGQSVMLPYFDDDGVLRAKAVCDPADSCLEILTTADLTDYTGYATVRYTKS